MGTEYYDPRRSYTENYNEGPFGQFASMPPESLTTHDAVDFLGHKIDIPFGIPAGPLLNSNYVIAAWNWGYSLVTYKTVRGQDYPCHPAPNVIRVHSPFLEIHPGDTVVGDLHMEIIDITKDGITNSFGVPSKSPDVWQEDVRRALEKMQHGHNVLILSFMGTKREGMSFEEYVADFVETQKLAAQTGVPILEVNFSCPNVGKEGLVCYDIEASRFLLKAMRNERDNLPLLVKIGYFGPETQPKLEALLDVIHDYASGVVAINTIQAKVVNDSGVQILPGNSVRLQSGICGVAIKWAGIEMAERIVAYKKKKKWKDFVVVGVGGVISPDDYFAYMKLGVDAVQSATGTMWKPTLAFEIRKEIGSR